MFLKNNNNSQEDERQEAKYKNEPADLGKITPFDIVTGMVIAVFAVISLIPLLWMVRTSLIPSSDALDLHKFVRPTLSNITEIWNAAPFGVYYINTIIMVSAVLLVQFVSITLSGYAFARIDFYGKNLLFMLFLTQMMVSADVLIMPNYKFISSLGLADTKTGVILPFFTSAMGILMMRQTVRTIPYELEEAAKIDGCGLLRTIFTIYVPLLKPVYIAFGLVSASYQWNNFLWPLVMVNSESNRPLTLGLAIFAMAAETGANWSATCAATLIVVLPLLLIFVIFQKQFMKSFATSGIK